MMTKFTTTTRIVRRRHRAIVLFYSILPENWTVNREDLGTGFSFGSEYKMAEHFTRFTRKKCASYWLKT